MVYSIFFTRSTNTLKPSLDEHFISLGRSFQILTPEILIDRCVLVLVIVAF